MERTASCASCHRAVFEDDAFCSGCGTPLRNRDSRTGASRRSLVSQTVPTGERTSCGSCNGPVLPGSIFCSTCGARAVADAPAADEPSDAIPRRVTAASRGKYEYVGTLGRGGMGMVFTARDAELERLVAIKVLSPSWLADPSMVERFQREARTIASLRHESIVNVYEVGRADALYYFVMDFIEGVPLSRILRRYGPLPIRVVQAVFYQVASALAYAHRPERKIVHRDVKPSNIMVDREGRATLMDFGIAKATETPSGLTRTGLVIGTPEYMSPEQCRGHTVTVESDQYSLGTVLYAMLTGAPPFTGPFYQVLMAHQNEEVPPILEVRPDCPPDLAAATERMLSKVPGERWPGIRDALRALALRPLPPDDPVLQQIGLMVRETAEAPVSGAGAGETGPDQPGRTATSIRVDPLPSELEVGDDLRLNATVLFADGGEDPDTAVSWESTDPAIVRVDGSTGQLVAVAPGQAVLRAVGAGVSESVAVQVRPPRVARVELEPRQLALAVGESVRLRAQPLSRQDQPLERKVTWSSSDPRTLLVEPDGTATAEREGVVSVLVHCDGVGAATSVRVTPPAEASARAPVRPERPAPLPRETAVTGAGNRTPTGPSTEPGQTASLGRRPVEPESGPSPGRASTGPADAPPLAEVLASIRRVLVDVRDAVAPEGRARRALLLWLPGVAVVALVGLWLAGGPDSGAPSVEEVVVLGPGDAPLPEEGLELRPGDTVAMGARLLDRTGAELGDARSVQWTSQDPAVARIDPAGLLVAVAEGSTGILAAAGSAETAIPLSVRTPARTVVIHRPGDPDGPVTNVEVDPGSSTDLSATLLEDGRPLPDSVSWRSSDPAIATVSGGGRVTGRRPGEARMRAEGGGVDASVLVRVVAPATPPEPEPAYGILEIQVRPWAWVFVDDLRWGQERQTRVELTLDVGRHMIRLEAPEHERFDTTITIREDDRTVIRKSLAESGG